MEELLNQGLPNVYQGYINRNGTKKFKFWKHLITKKKLYIENLEDKEKKHLITKEDFTKRIKNIKIALDNHCKGTEKRWCFNFKKEKEDCLLLNYITIYLPELKVERQDKYKKSRIYKDFCIKIFLSKYEDSILFSVLDIFKLSIEEKEIISKYEDIESCVFTIHPHYRDVTYSNFLNLINKDKISNDFCYGSGEMSEFMGSLPFKNYSTIESIEHIIYSIEEYYKSESPEGGAYRTLELLSERREESFENINILYPAQIKNRLNSFLFNLDKENLNKLYDIFKKCDYIENKHSFKILNSSFDVFMVDFLDLIYENISELERDKYIFYRLSGNYVSLYEYLIYSEKLEKIEKNNFGKRNEIIETGLKATIDDVVIPINIVRSNRIILNRVDLDLESFSFPTEILKEILIEHINKKLNETITRKQKEFVNIG